MTTDITTEFTLTKDQASRLSAWRAWWEESEERYRHWELRDQDEETVAAFGRILRDSDFAAGNDLSVVQLDRLCQLARRLAANPNLDRRLYTGSGEPEEFNALLRRLLYGMEPLPVRLTAFLERRRVGAQTVSQLLSAAYPARYPILSPASFSALDLTPEQRRMAQAQAAAEYGMDAANPRDPAQRILGGFVIYAAIRRCLGGIGYPEVHRILQLAPREAGAAMLAVPAASVQEQRATYAPADVTEEDLLFHVEAFVAERGFTYPPLALHNYYVALKTRPFVILCGISGTGKTRLTQLFAEAMTGDPARQYRLLPVRPDWTDSTALLGYLNLLAGPEGRYVSTRFLDFLREAARPENAGRAFFLCLDEMNLARVEHYFADFLSAMETPAKEIPLHGEAVARIPANFFVTGSVNVDETTHTFSRKVLDRANTIEFSEVNFTAFGRSGIQSPTPERLNSRTPEQLQSLFLRCRVADVAAARSRLQVLGTAFVERTLETLTALNEAMAVSQVLFAYRVRDEILMYLANSFDARGRGLFDGDAERNYRIALDFQILQKVLPRLSGTQEQIEAALRALLSLLLPGSDLLASDAAENARALERLAEVAVYPRSARKLVRLLIRLQRDGYASFYEG
jgi:energy-coupling factor transporter ATP-binding protein EcfA2